jgi:bifunctional N-acetylglucosamine-1-phosphate-uridyltransferase/glucosamine-1-phosphate-acetyltransferase GlmU-like protein
MPHGRVLVIPAAGVGSRLGASRPKALVEVNGRPMLDHLFALHAPWIERAVVVAGPGFADEVRAHCADAPIPVDVDVQRAPTGMLDAMLVPRLRLAALQPRWVWVTWCDQVAIREETVARLAAAGESAPDALLAMPTCTGASPYIHFARDAAGRIVGVRQRREGDEMPEVGESDAGLFALSSRAYLELLPAFAGEHATGAATRERNFLPAIPWLQAQGPVVTFPVAEPVEAVGINTPEELRRVEAHLRNRGTERGVDRER